MNPPQVRPYIPAKPDRGAMAMQRAAEAMNLPPGHNVLCRPRELRKFRAAYTEAYMEIGRAMGCAAIVEFPAMCGCGAKPYPHRHGEEEKRRFAYHLSLGRGA